MAKTKLPTSLAFHAKMFKDAVREARSHLQRGRQRAWDAGKYALELKKLAEHGTWMNVCRDHLQVAPRTISDLIRFHRSCTRDEAAEIDNYQGFLRLKSREGNRCIYADLNSEEQHEALLGIPLRKKYELVHGLEAAVEAFKDLVMAPDSVGDGYAILAPYRGLTDNEHATDILHAVMARYAA